MSPAAAAAEETVGDWLLKALRPARGRSVGFDHRRADGELHRRWRRRGTRVLAAGGLGRRGATGSAGAPPLHVVVGAEVHVDGRSTPCGCSGFGRAPLSTRAPTIRGGCSPRRCEAALEDGRPTIVCAQAGNVNTGAFDPLGAIAAACARRTAPGCTSTARSGCGPRRRPRGPDSWRASEAADSWAVDAHKWLNVPVRRRVRLRRRPGRTARGDDAHRPRTCRSAPRTSATARTGRPRPPAARAASRSRRRCGSSGARASPSWSSATARLAARLAERLAAEPGVAILNDVVLNQVLVRFGDDDAATDAVVAAVQADGTCWLGGTRWQGRAAMRISISGWPTREEDADRSADAILAAWRAIRDA